GPEGEYRFVGVPAGQYRVEVEGNSEWTDKSSPAFTVGTRPVDLRPLGLPPAGAAAEEGEAPAEAGASPAEGPAMVEASAGVQDLVWMLMGGVALLPFHTSGARRSAPAARNSETGGHTAL